MKTSKKLPTLTLVAFVSIFAPTVARAAGAGAVGAAGASIAPSAGTARASATSAAAAPVSVSPSTTAMNPVTSPVVPSTSPVMPDVAPINPTVNLSAAELSAQQQAATANSSVNPVLAPTFIDGAVNPAIKANLTSSNGAIPNGDPHAGANSTGGDANFVNPNGSLVSNNNGQLNANGTMGGVAGNSLPPLTGAQQTLSEITSSNQSNRAVTLTRIDSGLQANQRTIADLRLAGRQLKDDARKQFDTAYDEVRTQEKNLRKSLNEARNASSNDYGDARAILAFDYQNYSDALDRAEALARAPSASGGINR